MCLAVCLILYISLIFVSSQCYDSTTACANSWKYSPSNCQPSLSDLLPTHDITDYCYDNDKILWKRGITDGSITSTGIIVEYDFILCQESFSLCGYVALQGAASATCGEPDQVLKTSGIKFGGGINLGYTTSTTLQSIGASQSTLNTLNAYFGVRGSEAAETICNAPFTLDQTVAYDLTLALMAEYSKQMQTWYDNERDDGTLTFIELPKGIQTVLTSIHWKWGIKFKYHDFWKYIKSNDFENAVGALRAWYNGGASDQRLQSEANVMEASLGCVSSIDCVFLLDESGSVTQTNFDTSLDWVSEFIGSFDQSSLDQTLSKKGSRFGAATFSSGYTDHFFLNTYSTRSDYQNNVLSIGYDAGGTYLGAALTQIGPAQFIEANGMRASSLGIPRLLMVLTDGASADNVVAGVATLAALNLNIIAIGIGNYNLPQLQDITTDDNIYGIDNFAQLSEILDGVLTQTCYIPTQLNIGDVIEDVSLQNGQNQYFQFKTSGNKNKNMILNVNQLRGCVYLYISYCTQYPSYYVHDVKFTSCSQPTKQIVLSSEPQDCSQYEGRRRLQQSNISETVYIGFEGRGDNASVFNMVTDTCNVTVCNVGTNYDGSLDNDDPYFVEYATITTPSPTPHPTSSPTAMPTPNTSYPTTAEPTAAETTKMYTSTTHSTLAEGNQDGNDDETEVDYVVPIIIVWIVIFILVGIICLVIWWKRNNVKKEEENHVEMIKSMNTTQ